MQDTTFITAIMCLTMWAGLIAAFVLSAKQSKERQLKQEITRLKRRLARYE